MKRWIIIALMFVFLLQYVSADCYVLYSKDGNPLSSCTEDSSAIPPKTTYSILTNCHCKSKYLRVFDDVCSIDVEYFKYDNGYFLERRQTKNIPINKEKCPPCIGEGPNGPSGPYDSYGQTGMISCLAQKENRICNKMGWQYASEFSEWTLAEKYMDAEAGLQCGWEDRDYNDPFNWLNGGCSHIFDPSGDLKGSIYNLLVLNYKPCNPDAKQVTTCEEKCLAIEDRHGGCMASPDNHHPGALRQDGKYEDCLVGESCYCENKKPVIEKITLFVDPKYLKEMGFREDYGPYEFIGQVREDEEGYSEPYELGAGTVREDDKLICKAEVYKAGIIGGPSAQEREKIAADIYVWVDGVRKGLIGKGVNCPYNIDTDTYECEEKFVPAGRGREFSCEAIPKDRFEKGEGEKSNALKTAQFVYYAVPIFSPGEFSSFFGSENLMPELKAKHCSEIYKKTTEIYKESTLIVQFNRFTKISRVDDKTELTGKLVLLNGEVVGSPLERPESLAISNIRVIRQLRRKIIGRFNYEFNRKLDRIIALDDLNIGKTIFTFTPQRGGYIIPNSLVGHMESEVVIIDYRAMNSLILQHNLGHAYAGYCDEDLFLSWVKQNIQQLFGCPNKFPKSCSKLGVCSGMPYAEDKVTRMDEKPDDAKFWSSMGDHGGYVQSLIYPLPGHPVLREPFGMGK